MLRMNQLSGFGGLVNPGVLVATGSALATNSPSFSVDLGPPGIKQVLCAFATGDLSVGNDTWTWGTGAVGGEAFTYAVGTGGVFAFNGANFTAGATIRAIETSLYGVQTIDIGIVGFTGVMDTTRMLALVVRGVSPTPIAFDGGQNQTASPAGNDVTLNTAGARVVIAATVAATAPGNFQGPGAEVTAVSTANFALGYDLAPAGGAADVYSFTGGKYVIAGASFG